MADNDKPGSKSATTSEPAGPSLRLVRGNASPEELAALVAVLASASDDDDDDGDQGRDPHSLAVGRKIQSRWSSPRRMVRLTPPHGQGAWRASARSR